MIEKVFFFYLPIILFDIQTKPTSNFLNTQKKNKCFVAPIYVLPFSYLPSNRGTLDRMKEFSRYYLGNKESFYWLSCRFDRI